MSKLTDCPGGCGARFSATLCEGNGAGKCPECGTLLEACPLCDAVHDLVAWLDADDPKCCLGCGSTLEALRLLNSNEISESELVSPTAGDGPPYRVPDDWSPSIDYPEDGPPEVVADGG